MISINVDKIVMGVLAVAVYGFGAYALLLNNPENLLLWVKVMMLRYVLMVLALMLVTIPSELLTDNFGVQMDINSTQLRVTHKLFDFVEYWFAEGLLGLAYTNAGYGLIGLAMICSILLSSGIIFIGRSRAQYVKTLIDKREGR